MRELHVVQAEVGERVLSDVDDALPDGDRQRQRGDHERFAELRLSGVLRVEVRLVGVHAQQREPGVVGLADRATERMAVDVPDLEVLVEPALPTLAYLRRTTHGRRS